MAGGEIKKGVLAYSGGLDTSVILKWLQETYACEVVTFTADLGQGEELAPARKKAEMFGVKEVFIDDLREEFEIPIAKDKRGEAPFSVDANLLHISAEGKVLEDPWIEPEEFVYSRTVAPEKAPDQPEYVEVEFKRGDAVGVNGTALSPAALLTELNRLGGKHGIGRLDLVENPFLGMKSRRVYETPGGTRLPCAHRGLEST